MKFEKEVIDPSVAFHALDRGDVVRLNDDEGDFIVFSLDDVIGVIKRAAVYEWEYHELCGFKADNEPDGYVRLIWPDDIRSIQYRTPLEPQRGDRVLVDWDDGLNSGVHMGVVDEVKRGAYQVHVIEGPASGGRHWDVEVEEDAILDMNSQRRAAYERCCCLDSPITKIQRIDQQTRFRSRSTELPWHRKPVARQEINPIEKFFWLAIVIGAMISLGLFFFWQ